MPALVNDRTRQIVASQLELAVTRKTRKQGLLGRTSLDEDAAMLISPCMAVHTVGMGFPIDVAFVNRQGEAVHLVHRLQPWRIAGSVRAHAVVEMAAGRIEACGIEIGDKLLVSSECGPEGSTQR